jgi:hypothetical protein
MVFSSVALLEAQDSDAQRAAPAAHLVGYLAQKRPLLRKDAKNSRNAWYSVFLEGRLRRTMADTTISL